MTTTRQNTTTATTPRATAEEARHLADLIRLQFKLHELLPRLYRMLSAGQPVTVDQVATGAGWTPDEVRAELNRHPGVDLDDRGRIIGLGLTLRRTPHAFTFGQQTVYAFCASNALLFPVILQQAGVIGSACLASGQPIRVELTADAVTRVEPATAVVSRVRPGHAVDDVRAQICALGNFFASPDAAAGWLTANKPHGTVVPVAQDFDITRTAAISLGWTAS
jgi:alkylmercury lyase